MDFFNALTSFGMSIGEAKDYANDLQKMFDNNYTPSAYWACDATGAYKECFTLSPSIIVKFASIENKTEETEIPIYEKAIEERVSAIFAKTYFICLKKPLPPYFTIDDFDYLIVQEKAHTILFEKGEIESREEEEEKIRRYLPNLWRAIQNFDYINDIIAFYGKPFARRLDSFIRHERIYDLHDRNLGYRKDGSPIIFDFCS